LFKALNKYTKGMEQETNAQKKRPLSIVFSNAVSNTVFLLFIEL